MSFTDKNIYELLPSFYRVRDDERGNPLRALIEIIAREAKLTESNIAALYENWFIETCEEWVVPYIGDLLGVRGLHSISGSKTISQRAYVANTLSYRRRKGIAPVLEQLALDIAGWRGHAVEFFELLGTTQYMNHIRLYRPVAPDLRKMNQLDQLNTAFDKIAHTADVRHISSGRGRHNIPNLGLFIWRLQSYPVTLSEAVRVNYPPDLPKPPAHFFTFDPTGNNVHLFNRPITEDAITHLSAEINVPGMLRRRALFDELEARRQAFIDNVTPAYQYFDDTLAIEGDPASKKHSVFEIFKNDDIDPVPPLEILICNLETRCTPPLTKTYKKLQSDGSYTDVALPITVVADPVNGRFMFTDSAGILKARVSYSYGFSDDTGSGTYNRQDDIPDIFQQEIVWHVGVSKTILAEGPEKIVNTVKLAIDEWNALPPGNTGVITVMDNRSYTDDLDITIKENSRLVIIAADWPVREDTETIPPTKKRIPGDMAAAGLRPHLACDIAVNGVVEDGAGNPDYDKKAGGELIIDGLLIEGKLSVLEGNLRAIEINHCTLIPGMGGFEIGGDTTEPKSNQWLGINLKRTICGPVHLHATAAASLNIEDCIIDNKGDFALLAEKMPVSFKRTTFFGKITVKSVEAENCIFEDIIKAIRRQIGCIRFSFVPWLDSETPRRFRCQPELEMITQIDDKGIFITDPEKTIIRNKIAAWLLPIFTSTMYGYHAYAQLAHTCPAQVSAGSDDGSEMGAFSSLMQPQRAANLRIALDEYLPLGLEAGIIYTT